MAVREVILDGVRGRQRDGGAVPGAPRRPIRYILEFEVPPEPGDVASAIGRDLRISVGVARLSEAHRQGGGGPDDGLARFLAVTVDGIEPADIAGSPFEVGYALADAAGAVTAEPELGTDFYVVPRRGDPDVQAEVDVPFGCWVDQAEDPSGANRLWALEKIQAIAAWERPPNEGGRARGEGIRVFQPDTGVADHAELEAGLIDMAGAYDFIADAPGALDPLDYDGNPGHGTGTASVVASRVDGGMSGAAPLASLVPLRAVESVVVLDHGRVAAAVEHARRNGAHVITMSLGGAWSSSLRAAIGRAIEDGVIVLAAAGNCVGAVVWPARYEEVIAVAASNIHDRPWQGSCRGGAVDVTAPGEFVPRANRAPENGGSPTDVRGGQGTSFAVALTAGVAALWLAHNGIDAIKASLGPGETVQGRFVRLLRETSWRPAGFDTGAFGAGIVHAADLLGRGIGAAGAAGPTASFDAPAAYSDSLHSLRTLIAEGMEAPADVRPEAVAVEAAAPDGLAGRRFAAELSHLALRARRATDRTAGTPGPVAAEPAEPGFAMSPTLAEVIRQRVARDLAG